MFYREFAKRAQEEGWAAIAVLLFFGVMLLCLGIVLVVTVGSKPAVMALFGPGAGFVISGSVFLTAHRVARNRRPKTGGDIAHQYGPHPSHMRRGSSRRNGRVLHMELAP